MLEYFTAKKIKKHQEEKKQRAAAAEAVSPKVQTPPPVAVLSGPQPILSDEDEHFLQRIVSAEGTPPALPERPAYLAPSVGDPSENDAQLVVHDTASSTQTQDKGKGKEKESLTDKEKNTAKKASNRFSFITSKFGKKKDDGLHPVNSAVSAKEAEKEEVDINKVLDELNLSAVNNRAFSVSKESQVLVQKFTLILKDIVNGAPTAYDDLVALIEDSQGTLAKSYDHLPSFLQKLITTLPNKLTSTLAPELMMVAAEAQALAGGSADGKKGAGGLKGAMKNLLVPGNLKELITKPGAVAGMLKYIMNFLKLRFPAFMGTNVLFSLGIFVLLFVFWYCHKRGREVRLEKEALAASAAGTIDGTGRVTELPDDPMLQPPPARSGTASRDRSQDSRRSRGSRREKEKEKEKEKVRK